MRLENEAFLVELNRLFQTNRDKGSVWVTFKQCTITPALFSHSRRGEEREGNKGQEEHRASQETKSG